ncbi:right-handed parallel beta-helix repeat-containing protein, partial [Candidatus Micrarchaeota archaeon]|nr:right-handed parallel beta-helix repeat-containing protein [Candidatus Micrarchaeota archaeon]
GVPASYYAFSSVTSSWNNTVLNTTFVRSKIYNDATSNLTVAWYARAHVTGNNGGNLQNADVNVSDALGRREFSGQTDASGLTAWFVVNDSTLGFSPVYYNNNSFSANRTNEGAISSGRNISSTQQVELVLPCGSLANSLTLSTNVSIATTCLDFTADSITLDCNGYSIASNGNGAGVNATGRKNIVIKNCNIRNFTVGVNFTKTNYSDILNNQVWNNSLYGVYFTTSNSSNITSNNVYNNSGYGVYLAYSSNNNTISSNNISNNSNTGIWIYLSSDNNTISSNNISNHSVYGILSSSSLYLNVSLNSISNNSYANVWIYSNNNSISNNNVSFSPRGIVLVGHNNTVFSNNVSNHSAVGIFFSSGNDNIVFFNILSSNTGYAVWLSTSRNNSVYLNNLSRGGVGVYAGASDLTAIYNNTINFSSGDAINFYNSNYSRIFNNTIYNLSSGTGISLQYSNNASITGNTIYNTSNTGVYLAYSLNASLSANRVLNETDGVIFISSNGSIQNPGLIEGNSGYSLLSTSSNVSVDSSDLGVSTRGKSLFAWYVNASVYNYTGEPAVGATVNVTNVSGHLASYSNTLFTVTSSFTTDSQGYTSNFYVYENKTNNDNTVTIYNNHSFRANKTEGGYGTNNTNVTGVSYPYTILINLSATCGLVANTSAVNFGTLAVGQTSSEEALTINNTGTVSSQVQISGTSWTSGSNSFSVTSSKFHNTTSGVAYASKYALESSNSLAYVPLAPLNIFTTYLQTLIPEGQETGTYTQTITYTVSCPPT